MTHWCLPTAAAVLLLVVVAGLIYPVLGSGRKKVERKGCLENLRRIRSARPALMPVCPSGGRYEIVETGSGPYPTCGRHGDLLKKMGYARSRPNTSTNEATGTNTPADARNQQEP